MKTKILLIAILFIPATSFAAAPADMVHFWKFDEGMGRSVNDTPGAGVVAQNGVLTGSSTGFGWASGKAGNALGMDGAAGTGVILPDGTLSGNVGTIAVWFKIDSFTDRNVLVSARATDDRNIYMALTFDLDGRPTLQWRENSTAADRKAQASKPLNKNEWYQLVWIADGSTYRAYINGEQATVAGESVGRWFPTFTNHNLSNRIGMIDSNVLNGSFTGYIDDLRVYERALTAGEVTDLYNETNAARPTIPAAANPPATPPMPTPAPSPASATVVLTSTNTSGGTLTVEQTLGGAQPMEESVRQAKIAEIRTLLTSLYMQLLELLKAQLAAKQAGQ